MVSQNDVADNYFNAVDRDHYNKGSNMYFEGDTLYSYGRHFILAIRVKNGYLLNGDKYSNTTANHQSLTRRYAPTNSAVIPFSALQNIFKHGQYSVEDRQKHKEELRNVEIIDKTEDTYEEYKTKDKDGNTVVKERHHLGATLIKYKKKYYLSSIDPGSKNYAYFLVELPKVPEKHNIIWIGKYVKHAMNYNHTVTEAYRLLASNLNDKEYQLYLNDEIKRQGEYFLIPTELKTKLLKDNAIPIKQANQELNNEIQEIQLRTPHIEKCLANAAIDFSNSSEEDKKNHDLNRYAQIKAGNKKYVVVFRDIANQIKLPDKFKIQGQQILTLSDEGVFKNFDLSEGIGNQHIATETIKTRGNIFIRGTLRHREHRMISLKRVWHRVIKNTAVNSWSAGGNVD